MINPILLAGLGLALQGCIGLKNLQDESTFAVSADPLFVSPQQVLNAIAQGPPPPPPPAPPGTTVPPPSQGSTDPIVVAVNGTLDQKKAFLGVVLMDSEQKCDAFLNRLAVAQAGINTTGDIVTTVLSGVATALSPIGTVHALTGASTIVGGSKTALNQDLWAKAGISEFEKALSTSYYASIKAYTSDLEQKTTVNIPIELTKIQSIHNFCTIASATNTINTTLSSPAPAPGPAPAGQPAGNTSVAVPGQSLQTYVSDAQTRNATFKPDETSTQIRRWLRPTAVGTSATGVMLDRNGQPAPADKPRLLALQGWLKLNGDPPLEIFLSSPDYANLRSRAVTEVMQSH